MWCYWVFPPSPPPVTARLPTKTHVNDAERRGSPNADSWEELRDASIRPIRIRHSITCRYCPHRPFSAFQLAGSCRDRTCEQNRWLLPPSLYPPSLSLLSFGGRAADGTRIREIKARSSCKELPPPRAATATDRPGPTRPSSVLRPREETKLSKNKERDECAA